MDKLSIYFREDKTIYTPGQTVQGAIQWSLETLSHGLDLSLFWYTAGKGTRDVGIVETRTFEHPGLCGSKEFAFTLPDGPYSFSGWLISLIWALELTCSKGEDMVRQEIVVSPTGREIALGEDSWMDDRPRGNPLERILGRQP